MTRRRAFVLLLAGAALGPAGVPAGAAPPVPLASGLTGNGRLLQPEGRMTTVGTFPVGGALTPDGRFFWSVDGGRGPATAVHVIETKTGRQRATLPLPGGYVGIAFAPDGRRAYVSGEAGDGTPQPAAAKGAGGDVIHVYDVNPQTGAVVEQAPISLPKTRAGAAARDELPPASSAKAFPAGLDVSPDGKTLVVALAQADQAAIVDVATGHVTLAGVGRYPYGVAIDPRRPRAYVTNERDGSVTALSLPDGKVLATLDVGGDYAHAQGITVDPVKDRAFVAVTGRDRVDVLDLAALKVSRSIAVGRPGGPIGTAPVNLDVAPDGRTLYVASSGEDAIVVVALDGLPAGASRPRRLVQSRSVTSIGRYLHARDRAARTRRRAGDTAAARRAYSRTLVGLRRDLLAGHPTRACAGPTAAQDRTYRLAVLRAYAARVRAGGTPAARRTFARAIRRALARRPALVRCPKVMTPPRAAKPFTVVGRLPTAAYPVDVDVSADGSRLVWVAAKGVGTGPNDGAEKNIDRLLLGRVGMLRPPTDAQLAKLTARVDRQLVPQSFAPAPAGSPVVGPGGGASDKIKYVFYVVRENRTYDQVLGSDPRGQGDPSHELFDDNGVAGPTGGVTPNLHALTRTFPLLDRVLANSEESTVGHKITAGGAVNDYTLRYVNSKRGKVGNPDIFPIGIPTPNAFVFDQAARQGLSFRVYGELGAANQPFGNDGRPTFGVVQSNTDPVYPSQLQGTCKGTTAVVPGAPLAERCTADAGDVGTTHGAPAVSSRIRSFQAVFDAQVAAGTVPRFNYAILFNDHTDGTSPGVYTPKADVADNDLALGQFVQLVSQSPIWAQSAIFVLEDDSQDGIDSVDAHRIPALVISPWARKGAVVHTQYDQFSFLRTAELVAGLKPLSINDAMATPLYDAFISAGAKPDVEGTRYRAIQPQQSLTQVNPADAPNARLSAQLPWDVTDTVPQRVSDRILWQSVFGAGATVPPPGPGASPSEHDRGVQAMERFHAGGDVRALLLGGAASDPDG